jgi:hypothetical protein
MQSIDHSLYVHDNQEVSLPWGVNIEDQLKKIEQEALILRNQGWLNLTLETKERLWGDPGETGLYLEGFRPRTEKELNQKRIQEASDKRQRRETYLKLKKEFENE